jgi:hypothetical protein
MNHEVGEFVELDRTAARFAELQIGRPDGPHLERFWR